jgi:predicted enzyme related to lactoylglutathione lyase
MGQPVMQFQILAKNADKAAEFYNNLFGWNIDTNNALGYRVVTTGSKQGIQGGIWPSPPAGHSMVQLFVEVEDVTAAVEQATELGGQVIIQPQTLPDGDEMAMIIDPEGISFGLFKPKGP